MLEGMAVRLLDGGPGRCPDMSKDNGRGDVRRNVLQVGVIPDRLHAAEQCRGFRLAIPSDSESVSIRRRRTEPRIKALVD